jgi:hypothetical protein
MFRSSEFDVEAELTTFTRNMIEKPAYKRMSETVSK